PASTAAISSASAVFQGFRPASLPTATTRDRGRLSLIATIRQEVLGVCGDPDVGQQRIPVHLLRRYGSQSSRDVRQRLHPVPLGPSQDAQTNRRRLAPLITS